jgi:hypothetical protein
MSGLPKHTELLEGLLQSIEPSVTTIDGGASRVRTSVTSVETDCGNSSSCVVSVSCRLVGDVGELREGR